MKKKLTIALIATTNSTIRSFMLTNIKRLNHFYNIFIYCNNATSLKKIVPKNVTLININFIRKPNLIIDFLTFLKLSYFLLKNRPYLTLSLTPKAGLLTALSSLIARVSYRVHWYTGQFWVTKKGFFRFFYKTLDQLIFYFSHHVLVDSHSQKKFLLFNNIISNDKSSVLLNGSVGGVNVNKFKFKKANRDFLKKKLKINKSDFIFLYLGRMNKDKGIFDLIKAFKKIENSHKALLVLVGPIEDTAIKNLIGKNKKIIYVGKTKTPEIWYSIANILCLPSYREGFGSVVIEAGSCKVPTLGSNIYGINDAIEKDLTGFFHKVGSINDIKRKMIFSVRNRKLLKKYGKRARKRVKEKFEENLISQNLLEFINSRKN